MLSGGLRRELGVRVALTFGEVGFARVRYFGSRPLVFAVNRLALKRRWFDTPLQHRNRRRVCLEYGLAQSCNGFLTLLHSDTV